MSTDWGKLNEDRVRTALSNADPEIARVLKRHPDNVLASDSAAAKRLEWTTPSHGKVLVLTEDGIGDPFQRKHTYEAFQAAVRELERVTGEEWGWESVNPAVHYFYMVGMRNNPRSQRPTVGTWRQVVRDMATWDEGHTAPAVEIMKDESKTAPQAIRQLEKDYATERMRRVWREQVASDLAEYGLRTNDQLDEAYKVYVEAFIAASRSRVMRGMSTVNPGGSVLVGPRWSSARDKLRSAAAKKNPSNEEEEAAIERYKAFHRRDPKALGDFPRDFEIPIRMLCVGPAKWVTYRSDKVDPATLKKPKRPINYIHEHNAGVMVYVPIEIGAEMGWSGTDSPYDDFTKVVDVPREFAQAQALTKLGESLGFKFTIGESWNAEEIEAESEDPLPELYCTPDGKCLLVIQDKTEVLAMIWGGALGVFPRGIDG